MPWPMLCEVVLCSLVFLASTGRCTVQGQTVYAEENIFAQGRCTHFNAIEEGNVCGSIVTWPVYMAGIHPEDEGYETMEYKYNNIKNYATSLLPLLDRPGCKTDFVVFMCPLLYPPCFEIDAQGVGQPLWAETNFPYEEGAVRGVDDGLRIFPRGSCYDACTTLHAGECEEKLGQARGFMASGATVIPVPIIDDNSECSNDFYGGDTSLAREVTKDWFINMVTYPPEFDGQMIFPLEGGNTVEGFGTIPCFNANDFTAGACFKPPVQECTRKGTYPNPYSAGYEACVGESCETADEERCAKSVCPEDFVRESGLSACNLACVDACPAEMFNDDQISSMWMCLVVPALLGLPLNLYTCGAYVLGRKNVHKKTPASLQIAAVLAVVWTFLQVFPALLLYTDVNCAYDVGIAVGSSLGCEMQRGVNHILQAMLYWVFCTVLDLHLAVVNGKTPAKRKEYTKFYHLLCWGVPGVMAALTYGLQVRSVELLFRASDFDGAYPAFAWNRYKDLFTCTPKLQTINEELCIVFLHYLLAALGTFVVLASVLKHIGNTFKKTSHKDKAKDRTASQTIDGAPTGFMASLKGFKKAMDKYGATKLTLLGMAAFTLVILLLVTIFATFPRMDNFIDFYTQEYQCSIQANADYAECTRSNELDVDELPEICEGRYCLDDQSCCERYDPVLQGVAPDPLVLGIGYYMSLSLIPLIFGLLFGLDKKHSTAWKKQFGMKVAPGASTASSSVQSSSAN